LLGGIVGSHPTFQFEPIGVRERHGGGSSGHGRHFIAAQTICLLIYETLH
jgi:hypothetical protein